MTHSVMTEPFDQYSSGGQSRPSFYVCRSISRPSGITESSYSTLVNETIKDLNRIARLGENWDGFDSPPPDPEAIKQAKKWILTMEPSVGVEEALKPHVSASEDGEVTFEWWNEERKLTLYFSDNRIEYLRISGPNIHSEMENGQLYGDCFRKLWEWLMHG